MPLTNFPYGVSSFGVPVMPGAPLFTGNAWFVDPANGSDSQQGTSPSRAFATLYAAYDVAASGNNDVIYLIGNGAASGTARLSTALAQSVTAAATTGTLTWAKDALHLVGVCSNTRVAQRARIAPPSGTYTQATFGSGNFIVVTGNGCQFQNISVFNGFSTGGTNQIAWTDNGSRNAYLNCNIFGMADAASAADAGSRSVKIGSGGSGESTWINCVIGGDTVTRSAANASLEFAGATPRNSFINCTFPFMTSAATPLGILGTGNGCMDRWQLFQDCTFINNVKSTSTTMTVLASFTTASPGGLLLLKSCTAAGITDLGDANAFSNTFIDGGAPTAATTGLAVAPA